MNAMKHNKNEKRKLIMKNYAAVATSRGSTGCCGSGCSCSDTLVDAREAARTLGYSDDDLSAVPDAANMGLGCGNPLAIAALKPGETVLDLGSGGGFDCFLARRQVGPDGYVIGVDMTPEMVMLARQNAQKGNYANMSFRLGEIEHLPVADASVDVIISNCVINLAQEKGQVFLEAWRVLKTGGRLSISDVVATAELPARIKNNMSLLSGCIAGAEHVEKIRHMLQKAGFTDIRMTPKDNSREILSSWVPGSKAEDYVASYIIEATKQIEENNKIQH
jgi:SAM-dependent methyltransferase